MHKSKIAPVVAGIVIVIGAALWIWNIMTIDYSRMLGQGQGEQPVVNSPAHTTSVDTKQGQP